MEIRLYCELKANDKKTGKLLGVSTGVYYLDENDFKALIRLGAERYVERLNSEIEAFLKEDLKEDILNDNVVFDLDVTLLDDDFDDEDEDEEE